MRLRAWARRPVEVLKRSCVRHTVIGAIASPVDGDVPVTLIVAFNEPTEENASRTKAALAASGYLADIGDDDCLQKRF